MPRLPRLIIPDWPVHVVQRGHDRNPIFFSEDDYWKYLHDLEEASATSGCAIHAYVLMTNHVHILMTPQHHSSVAQCIQDIGRRYVRFINGKYRRSGSLWEGRFRSSLIESDSYLLACYRYIELNPVRAKMVDRPARYPWSSYHHNARGKVNSLVSEHATYQALANPENLRNAYQSLFENPLPANTLKAFREGIQRTGYVGNEKFRESIEKMLKRSITRRAHGGARR